MKAKIIGKSDNLFEGFQLSSSVEVKIGPVAPIRKGVKIHPLTINEINGWIEITRTEVFDDKVLIEGWSEIDGCVGKLCFLF